MSANVDPAEAEAIRDVLTEDAEPVVEERDFSKPRRFSPADLFEVKEGLGPALTLIEQRLAGSTGVRYSIEVTEVEEVSADDALDAYAAPLVGLRFAVASQPAWLMWSSEAAIAAIERTLGSTDKPKKGRHLSPLEVTLAEGLLSVVAEGLALALGLEASDMGVVQTERAMGSWRDGGESGSPHRLAIEIALEAPAGKSAMTAYLPIGRADDALAQLAQGSVELSRRLASVEVDVRARLGTCHVLLRQLLELEVGDVVPLDASVGDHAEITVDDHVFARGFLGTHRGRLAVRIDEFENELPGQNERAK